MMPNVMPTHVRKLLVIWLMNGTFFSLSNDMTSYANKCIYVYQNSVYFFLIKVNIINHISFGDSARMTYAILFRCILSAGMCNTVVAAVKSLCEIL